MIKVMVVSPSMVRRRAIVIKKGTQGGRKGSRGLIGEVGWMDDASLIVIMVEESKVGS